LCLDIGVHYRKPSEVAEDIGVTANTIRRWVRQFSIHGDDAFPGKGHLRPAEARERELQKQIQDLKEENEILKKAMAIFSKGVR
jgi:transposase